jgi:D-3-phosphoglycerate dehydrogenase / 2-oxoglutarate reductase
MFLTHSPLSSQAAMAADTIRDFLETGTIRNSVNFPDTSLPDRPEKTIRVTVVNKNQPGMLAQIMDTFAKANLNIVQQINQSRGQIAYNVLDIEPVTPDGSNANLQDVQRTVTTLDGVLSSRILFGTPGAGYARNVDGEYFV